MTVYRETSPFTNPDYASLANVLYRAYDQAANGKGKERHANDLPFEEQPMQTVSELVGDNHGLAFQAIKKVQESMVLPEQEARVRELLGAINYIAGMIIFDERRMPDD